MITEPAPARFYDRIYATSAGYRHAADPAVHGAWFDVWEWGAGGINLETDRVLDLGCGPGHFAELLVSKGFDPSRYMGIDFSEVAISQATLRVPGTTFVADELPTNLKQLIETHRPTVITALEVIEHVSSEVEAAFLGTGVRTLITVPRRDDASHLRFFPTKGDAETYYGRKVQAVGGTHWGFEVAPCLTSPS